MKNKIIILAMAVSLSSCFTDNKDAYRVLSDQGYTDIKITGYSCFVCDKSDFYSTGFTAKTAAGKEVKGVVCKGIFKGSTIRLF